MSELAPFGTPVGTVLAAAVNQTIFYSIVAGNDLGIKDDIPYLTCASEQININTTNVCFDHARSHTFCR